VRLLNLAVISLFAASALAETPWEQHGPLRVSANGRIVEHTDGTPFLWLGDTAWHLYTLREADIDRYLRDRAGKGFNVVHVMAAKGDLSRREFGFATAPALNSVYLHMNARGHIPFISMSPITLNEEYWKSIDHIVKSAARYGLYVCLTAIWGEGAKEWFPKPEQGNFEYGRILGERYKSEPNVLWTAVGEFVKVGRRGLRGPITKEEERLLDRIGEGLRAGAAKGQLIGMHGNQFRDAMPSTYFHDKPWLDVHMNQSWDRFGYIADMAGIDRALTPAKPTFLSEGKYENSPLTSGDYKGLPGSAWMMRFQAYWSVFLGGLGHTYGAENIWNCDGKLDHNALALPGSSQAPLLRKLFATRSLKDLEPAPGIVVSAAGDDETLDLIVAARSTHGRWALVYDTTGSGMRLDLSSLGPKQFDARWFDPRAGVFERIGTVKAGSEVSFDPPGAPRPENDWVLVLDAVE
jgi:hypothetical protein